VGDCNGDGRVLTDELVRCVAIALGNANTNQCGLADGSDQSVTVDRIVAAVQAALKGCPTVGPAATATPSPSATAAPSPTVTATLSATPTPTFTATSVPNRPPVIAPAAIYRTYPGYPIALPIGVTDPDGNGVLCSADTLPAGASLDATPPLLSWTPSADQLGPFNASFTCTDDGAPPLSADGQVTIQVNPVDGCTNPQCIPATGCVNTLPALNQACCADGPAVHVPQAKADCPGGRVVFAGRNDDVDTNGIGRLQNCDRLRVFNSGQSSATVRFHIEARCLDTSGTVTLRARLETSSRLLFNRDRVVTLRPEADGYLRAYSLSYSVGGSRPYFDLTNAEANLTLTLFDSTGAQVSTAVRLILGFDPLPDIPPVD